MPSVRVPPALWVVPGALEVNYWYVFWYVSICQMQSKVFVAYRIISNQPLVGDLHRLMFLVFWEFQLWLSGVIVAFAGRLRLCVGPVQRTCGAPGRGTGSDLDPVAACPLHHGSLREITSCWTNVAEIPAGRFGKSLLWSCFGRLSLGMCLFHHFTLRGWNAGAPTLFVGVQFSGYPTMCSI